MEDSRLDVSSKLTSHGHLSDWPPVEGCRRRRFRDGRIENLSKTAIGRKKIGKTLIHASLRNKKFGWVLTCQTGICLKMMIFQQTSTSTSEKVRLDCLIHLEILMQNLKLHQSDSVYEYLLHFLTHSVRLCSSIQSNAYDIPRCTDHPRWRNCAVRGGGKEAAKEIYWCRWMLYLEFALYRFMRCIKSEF